MLKSLLAIIFTLILCIPFIPTNYGLDDVVQQQLVEDIQESNNTSNSTLEEEHKLLKIVHYSFPGQEPFIVSKTAPKYFLSDECLYKHVHLKELIQPPSIFI